MTPKTPVPSRPSRAVWPALCILAMGALCAPGCGRDAPAQPDDHAEAEPDGAMPSDRVAIPASVRANLGITFVGAERRRIEQTLRAPGRFEYEPTARREYRTMLPGRVELLVGQFDVVEPGQALYRIDSPAWRDLQQQLAQASASIERLTTTLATFDPLQEAHARHEQGLVESIGVWTSRVEQLEAVREAGGGRINELASARSALASARAELAGVQEKRAELQASRAEASADLDAAGSRLEFLLGWASSLIGVDVAALEASVQTPRGPTARWATIDRIDVRAEEAGVVERPALTNGAWADEKSTVLTVVRPDRLRFVASGLQSDLGVLRDGLAARIVSPTPTTSGRSISLADTMRGTLRVGLSGNPQERTIELYVTPETLASWARPGVSAQLEIVTDSTASPELSIPLAAVQRDGLTPVIFRRDPSSPSQAIRMEADLGANDGRWVSVLSGLRDGDEVVLDGAFQLMLATSGSIQKGGHFHADGTFHEGED